MAKVARTLCDRCESRMTAGDPFCGSCGHPTTWASHDERTAWEVAQYREKNANAPIRSIVGDAPRARAAARTDVTSRAGASRERKHFGGLFARRRHQDTALVLPEPKRVEPPAEVKAEASPTAVLTMVRPERAPQEVAPKTTPRLRMTTERPVVAKPKQAIKPTVATTVESGLVSKVERAMNDREVLADTPATVVAMRLLNQRVRELDEKVQKLERELAAARTAAEPPKPRKRFGR